MRWDEIRRDVWEIPAARTKSGRTHAVPLTPAMRKLLEKRRAVTKDDVPVVFEGRHRGKPITTGSPGQALRKLKTDDDMLLGVPHWTQHDLRRTAFSGMTRLKVPRVVAHKVCNHAEGQIPKTYDRHHYFDEKLEALTTWNDHLVKLTKGAILPGVQL